MRCILFLFFTFSLSFSRAQLYMPRDIKAAYAKGSRSPDGRPGKNYWQNHAVYDIDMTALPPNRNIVGKESIVYFNESPDTLKGISLKLFLNIHNGGASREGSVSPDYLTDGVHIDNATADGAALKIPNNFAGANMTLKLPNAIAPHQSVRLHFEWHYTISLQSGREGMIDSSTWFLAYFYPRVAVYDDYNHWDRMPFVDSHEFYSDFNDYRVTVNVPENYLVTGTGTLQEPERLLQPEILRRYKSAMTSDKTINIVTAEDLAAKNITAKNRINSWQFRALNIPDMAFAISDHYNWDGCSVIVDDITKRRAAAFSMYDNKSKDYHFVAQQARHALDWLSHNWPGIPYPYEKTTVVQGFAGMEYPMMANDETYTDTTFSRFVAEHEIAHTYMPFYMGINETRYGFMDEGWATTFEYLIGIADMGAETASDFFKEFRVEGWINRTASEEDIPIITPGDALTGSGFGNNEYGKAALGYLAMKDLLGDEVFKKCLHGYMDRWHGKHPLPWDFFYSFNDVAGKDLNWFWNNWFFSNNYIDLAIVSAVKKNSSYEIKMQNIGGMPAPVDLIATFEDGSAATYHQTPAIWAKDHKEAIINIPAGKKISALKADGNIFMDADPANNAIRVSN